MSQFIKTTDKLMDWQQLHLNLVNGVFSKILSSTSPTYFSQTSHQRYFNRRILDKVQLQKSDAFKIHNETMLTNYHNLRKKLSIYARSKSHKIEKLFQSNKNEREDRQESDQIKKISVKAEKCDRVVFIDRKYNKEIVTKTAILSELENIQKLKQNYTRSKSTHHSTPLLDKANRQRKTYNPLVQKSINQNPLLRKREKTLKKRKKEVLFSGK